MRLMADTSVVAVDPRAVDAGVITQAVACLLDDGLVAFPTETVYGVGARADHPSALARLVAAKGRAPAKPFTVLVADAAAAAILAGVIPPAAQRLMRRYWPGPLTLVLPARDGGTIGLRCPDHPIAQALVRAAGVPIAAPSANRSGGAEPRTAADVLAQLDGAVDLVLDGGPARAGRPSTVVRVVGDGVEILRDGAIAAARILAAAGKGPGTGDRGQR